jgi:hypothetical protein
MYVGAADTAAPRAMTGGGGDDAFRDIVVFNAELDASITPRHGGRLESVFVRTRAGDTVAFVDPMLGRRLRGIGRYLPALSQGRSATHGAWCDLGGEDDRYSISHVRMGPDFALAVMVNEEEHSALLGARKSYLVPASGRCILVCYQLPHRIQALDTDIRLAGPAPATRVRAGAVSLPADDDVLCIGDGDTALWIARGADEAVTWIDPGARSTAREVRIRIRALERHVHLLLGVGETDLADSGERLERGRALLHAEDASIWGESTTTGMWLLRRRRNGAERG